VELKGNRVKITDCRATVSSENSSVQLCHWNVRFREGVQNRASQETCLNPVWQCFRERSRVE